MTIELTIPVIVFVILNSLYFILLWFVYAGLKKLNDRPANENKPTISIIISARNEESRIEPCLESLERLKYFENKHEVILVNDCSSDSTGNIVDEYCQRNSNWHVVHLKEKSSELRGKLNALETGISKSTGEIIFATDADCIVPAGWLQRMAAFFQSDVTMVLGHSPLLPGEGFFQRFQEFDNLFSAIVVASLTKIGYPFNSIGRNMAYRSVTLASVGGYGSLREFRSGDDIHLTDRFRTKNNGRIDYCADPETFVMTQPAKNIKEFLDQQIRKNSKTFVRSPLSMLLPIGLFAYHVLLLLFPFLFQHLFFTWLAFLCCKLILEFICLYKAATIFGQKQLIRYFALMQIIYPGYIIIMTILGGLQLYRWK